MISTLKSAAKNLNRPPGLLMKMLISSEHRITPTGTGRLVPIFDINYVLLHGIASS
jgi:hypothetical protein